MHHQSLCPRRAVKIAVISSAAFFWTAIVSAGVVRAEPTGENIIINPGFEEAGAGQNDAYGWHPFHSGYERYAMAYTGRQGIRLYNSDSAGMSGAYQRIDLGQTEIKPVFIGGYVRGQSIVNAPGGYFGAGLYAEIHLADGRVAYWNSVPNFGSFNWRWVGFNTGTLTFDGINKTVNAPISHIYIVPILARATGVAYFDDITAVEYEPGMAAVTLMFDDGELSTYTEAKPVMDAYNYDGSASIVTGYVGNDDFMTWEQIRELQSGGWEILSHGIGHYDMTRLSGTRINRELYGSLRILTQQGLSVRNFSLPYGAYNADIMARTAKYYSSARAFESGYNAQGAFPFEVKVKGVINTTKDDAVAAWISEVMARKEWLVLVFHTIAATGDDAYHTTPDDFAAIVKTVNDSGVQVVTYDQGINMFGTKK